MSVERKSASRIVLTPGLVMLLVVQGCTSWGTQVQFQRNDLIEAQLGQDQLPVGAERTSSLVRTQEQEIVCTGCKGTLNPVLVDSYGRSTVLSSDSFTARFERGRLVLPFVHQTYFHSKTTRTMTSEVTTYDVSFAQGQLSTNAANVRWIKAKKYNLFTATVGVFLGLLGATVPIAFAAEHKRWNVQATVTTGLGALGVYWAWDFFRPMPVVYSSMR